MNKIKQITMNISLNLSLNYLIVPIRDQTNLFLLNKSQYLKRIEKVTQQCCQAHFCLFCYCKSISNMMNSLPELPCGRCCTCNSTSCKYNK